MSHFTSAEIEYLRGQQLGRLATVGADGQPHVVPVGFRYNPEQDAVDIGGFGFAASKKYRDLMRNPRAAFVVDDLTSIDPWQPRGVEVRGEVEVLTTGGQEIMSGFDDVVVRIRPRRIVGWGIDGGPFAANARSVPAANG